MTKKLHSGNIEVAIAKHFDYRTHLIVPNIYWGLNFPYEIDLLILTESNAAWEIEIKTSLTDLKHDLKKRHQHDSNRIKRLYFAIPKSLLQKALSFIPENAGVLTIDDETSFVELIRPPKIRKFARLFTEEERLKLYKLAAMRIWSLKEKLYTFAYD